MNILVLNAGSSSLKFGLFRMEESGETRLVEGVLERVGTERAALALQVVGQPERREAVPAATPEQAAEQAFGCVATFTVDAVGYRVVHGGARFVAPARITPETLEAIRPLSPLAPLHNPVDLAGIETGLRLLPEVPAVAVFDTAFHHTLPAVAATYALPDSLSKQFGLRRYGFHGISHRYVSARLLECLGRPAEGTRLITCHLGSGASVCALRDGRSLDTSMGMTPLEGLVMGTRSGDVDPGLLLYLVNACGLSVGDIGDVLSHQSGLLGVSGCSSDVRDLERAAADGDARSLLALELFAYRVRKYIGAYAATLGGLDALAFTGGIGEHSPEMRSRICRDLDFLGLQLDEEANHADFRNDAIRICPPESRVAVWTIRCEEEHQIARETFELLHEA